MNASLKRKFCESIFWDYLDRSGFKIRENIIGLLVSQKKFYSQIAASYIFQKLRNGFSAIPFEIFCEIESTNAHFLEKNFARRAPFGPEFRFGKR